MVLNVSGKSRIKEVGKMKEKVIFRLAFLEGELEIDPEEKEYNIPLIKFSDEEKIKNGKIITEFGNDMIRFYRTKKIERGLPVFEPVSITISL